MLSIRGRATPAWRTAVQRLVHAVQQAEGVRFVELDVAVVADAAMARLHGLYLHDPTTTDVLTFDVSDGHPGVAGRRRGPRRVAGQIVVCRDQARRAAAARPHSVADELLLYVLHGLLHLAGHDDTTPRAYRRMHAREDELLAALGLPARFHA